MVDLYSGKTITTKADIWVMTTAPQPHHHNIHTTTTLYVPCGGPGVYATTNHTHHHNCACAGPGLYALQALLLLPAFRGVDPGHSVGPLLLPRVVEVFRGTLHFCAVQMSSIFICSSLIYSTFICSKLIYSTFIYSTYVCSAFFCSTVV